MILLAILLATTPPDIDCSKMKFFFQTYGKSEAEKIGKKLGYTDEQIKAAEAKCKIK